MTDIPYEIERKFLIRYPSESIFSSCFDRTDIVQTYLISAVPGVTERVRSRAHNTDSIYTHTVKKRITDMRREEYEEVITKAEYEELLKRADPGRNTIHKTRWLLEYRSQLFEIDIFNFWSDRAVLELELLDEAQEIEFPPGIEVIRELTCDKRYTNSSLALEVPYDEI